MGRVLWIVGQINNPLNPKGWGRHLTGNKIFTIYALCSPGRTTSAVVVVVKMIVGMDPSMGFIGFSNTVANPRGGWRPFLK